jgi:dTDP-4-dehydrorhamnose reductase
MLGHDVVRAATRAGHEVAAAAHADLDVTDAASVRAAVSAAGPDAVVNCAAYTNVDGAEDEPEEAMRVNGGGAEAVASAAESAGASVVYVSSDYVFDGTKREPYVESDRTAPMSSYGRSKLAGEEATAGSARRHLIVRSSWLFGTHGRNFVETILGLARDRDELRVVDDQVGCPTYTGQLADGIVRLVEAGAQGTHHLAGGGQCSWFEFAREILSRAGVSSRVLPCTTEEMPRPAPRPAYSVLRSEREDALELALWGEGLDRYLSEREVRA